MMSASSEKIQREDYDYWEREFLDHANAVTAKDIKDNQDEYIFRCDFFELKELIDVKPEAGSSYIRSACEPFDIEMELDLKKAETGWHILVCILIHRSTRQVI